jgi:chaperonin cofactor prefoldin
MNKQEVLSALEALLEEAKVAERKIDYSNQVERLERKVKTLQEELHNLQVILQNKGII